VSRARRRGVQAWGRSRGVKIFLSDGRRRERAESGYGQVSAGLIPQLTELGHEIVFEPDTSCDLCLFVCPPSSMRPGEIPLPTVAFTMHELEELPESKRDWVGTLNGTDLVVTPTVWNEMVWRRVGVTTPIAVVPLGIDPGTYFPARSHQFLILTAHENLGGTSSRENWRDTLSAYLMAFSPSDPVVLRIKTWKWKPDHFAAAIDAVMSELGLTDRPPIEPIGDELTASEMRQQYQECWLFVKNANREGWGLPATEAVACGATVAASRIEPLLSHLDHATTLWFDAGDVEGLVQLMRDRFAAYERSMSLARRHTWQRSAQALSAALQAHFG
jgi:hypothetical protein